jgi:hypothetical protein
VIICAVLAVLSAVPIPCSPLGSRQRRCGCADHHELELIARTVVSRPVAWRSYRLTPLHFDLKDYLSIFGELASLRSSENQQGANNDVHNVCRSKAKIRARRKPIYDLVKATGAEEKQNEATKQDDDTK